MTASNHSEQNLIEDVKRRLLPRRLPNLTGWEVAGCHESGACPGGDFYDLYPLPHGKFGIFLANAGEGGVPSLVSIGMLRVLLNTCPLSCGQSREPFCMFSDPVPQPPHLLLGHFNRVLAMSLPMDQCLVAFSGNLDPDSGDFQYSNAGYPAPFWWRAGLGRIEALRDAPGFPLGMEPNAAYHRRWQVVEPGDLLLFFNDALTGAVNRNGQILGCERIERAVRENAAQGATAVRDALIEQFNEHVGLTEHEDDVTVLAMKRVR